MAVNTGLAQLRRLRLAVYGRASRGESVQPAVLPENVGQSSPKFFGGCYSKKAPNHAKICGDQLKNAQDPQSNIVLPENVGQTSPQFFRGC